MSIARKTIYDRKPFLTPTDYGIKKSKEILDSSTNLEGFFVYKENGQIHTYSSQNIRSIIKLYE